MWLHSIKSKDGKVSYHGTIVGWHSYDEFLFVPVGGNKLEPWWAKLDYWDLYQGHVTFGKIKVSGE